MGVPVYAKQGFEDVGRLEIPMGEYGGEGAHVHGESPWWGVTMKGC